MEPKNFLIEGEPLVVTDLEVVYEYREKVLDPGEIYKDWEPTGRRLFGLNRETDSPLFLLIQREDMNHTPKLTTIRSVEQRLSLNEYRATKEAWHPTK